MKVHNVLFESLEDIKNVLTEAGLVDGVSLSETERKNSKKVIYWYISVRTAEDSKKTTYVTYRSTNFSPFQYGDGKPISYKADYQLDVFTNKENIKDLVTDLNNAFEGNGWTFELSNAEIEYDVANKLFTYPFKISKVFYDKN